jgi:mannose-6-phosphate isomerase-like protein (cupin superfamily)
MKPRHLVLTAQQQALEVPSELGLHTSGFRRWAAVDTDSSVHMRFGICELDPAGTVDAHLHSFEETFYVLAGEVVCETPEGSFLLREGDYGFVPVASPHAWRNVGSVPARWADMLAPQPRATGEGDTFKVDGFAPPGQPQPLDVRDPRTRSFGHIDAASMDVGNQTQEKMAVSASMRTALLVYSGITVKMMVDSDLGSFLQTMFMVQYEPNGFAGPHDHPFEEAYLILEGETDAVFDGHPYRLKPGDIAWAGVGCTHEFSNPADERVRWLETQAPQPPGRHSYRFARDWRYLGDALA